jgi:hypothetical protein
VRVARPVAIAETADGASDQTAIVRLRQDGTDTLSVTFYRVDDLNGTINGLHPGDAGYQAPLQSRAYQTAAGGTSIGGPGYGNYEQTTLSHVNAGDLVAMQLTNNTSGNSYLGFAQANEVVNGQHVAHLWNYGLNTWGWGHLRRRRPHYNDLVVGLDYHQRLGAAGSRELARRATPVARPAWWHPRLLSSLPDVPDRRRAPAGAAVRLIRRPNEAGARTRLSPPPPQNSAAAIAQSSGAQLAVSSVSSIPDPRPGSSAALMSRA